MTTGLLDNLKVQQLSNTTIKQFNNHAAWRETIQQ
jgi:hypothetical protein